MSSTRTLVDPVRVERREEIADVEDPDDLVEGAPEGRIPGVRRVDHRGETFLGRQVDRHGDHLGPRDHDVMDLLVGEVEDLVEHLLLRLLDHSGVLGLRPRSAGAPPPCG